MEDTLMKLNLGKGEMLLSVLYQDVLTSCTIFKTRVNILSLKPLTGSESPLVCFCCSVPPRFEDMRKIVKHNPK